LGVWATLVLTPIALGSVLERATALMEGACLTLFVLAWWGCLQRSEFQAPRALRWPILLFCLWSLFQMLPLPPPVLKVLAPGTNAAYSRFVPGYEQGREGDVQRWLLERDEPGSSALKARPDEKTGLEGALKVPSGWRPLAWYPWESVRWISRLLAYAAFLILVAGFLPVRALEKRIPWLVVSLGFALSLVGIIQYLDWNGKIFWLIPVYQGHPFGPWVNSNHFSGYMEMAMLLGAGLILKEAGMGSRRRRHRDFRRRAAPKIALGVFMLALIAVATIMARSRGGMFSLALAACTYFYFQAGPWLASRNLARAGKLLAVAPLLLCVAGITYYILKGSEIYVPETGVEASFAGRVTAWKGVIRMIGANPLTGTGLGSFSSAFPPFKEYGDSAVWDQAHNEYLQLITESGIVGFLLFAWGFVVFWRSDLGPRLSSPWRDQPPVVLGASLGILTLLFHSLVDFNLQIPSNGLLFVVLGGIVLGAHEGPEKSREARASGGESRGDLR
jgi:O-antigen ligase